MKEVIESHPRGNEVAILTESAPVSRERRAIVALIARGNAPPAYACDRNSTWALTISINNKKVTLIIYPLALTCPNWSGDTQ